MADVQHSTITDPNVHEPKGASTASTNTVYVADGSGSGTWKIVPVAALDEATILTDVEAAIVAGTITWSEDVYLFAKIADISTPDSVLIPLPDDCVVKSASVVLGAAITVADANISFKNAAAASMGTDVTVAFTGSAKGDQYAFTATGNNTITGPSYIEVATDGASTTTAPVYITVVISRATATV